MNNKVRVCKTCKIEKLHEEFPKHKAYKEGIRPNCIDCHRKIELGRYHKSKNIKGSSYCYNGDKNRNSKLILQFGIDHSEYLKLVELQEGKCKICKITLDFTVKHPPVDHCHMTGKIRGILCHQCNTALGGVKDSLEILNSMVSYLKEDNDCIRALCNIGFKTNYSKKVEERKGRIKGVTQTKMGKWKSVINVDSNRKVLGTYKTKVEAVKSRLEAEKRYNIQAKQDVLPHVIEFLKSAEAESAIALG